MLSEAKHLQLFELDGECRFFAMLRMTCRGRVAFFGKTTRAPLADYPSRTFVRPIRAGYANIFVLRGA